MHFAIQMLEGGVTRPSPRDLSLYILTAFAGIKSDNKKPEHWKVEAKDANESKIALIAKMHLSLTILPVYCTYLVITP